MSGNRALVACNRHGTTKRMRTPLESVPDYASGYKQQNALAVFADILAVFADAVSPSLHTLKISERKISERI